jgi:hypothetical protein
VRKTPTKTPQPEIIVVPPPTKKPKPPPVSVAPIAPKPKPVISKFRGRKGGRPFALTTA